MDNLKWRSRARIVAYLDLAVSSISFVTISIIGIFGNLLIAESTDKDRSAVWIIWWIFLIIMMIVICGDIYCAVLLLKATKSEAELDFAEKSAKYWRNVNILCLILSFVVGLPTSVYGQLLGHFLYRGTLIFIVHKFIGELRENNKFATIPPA